MLIESAKSLALAHLEEIGTDRFRADTFVAGNRKMRRVYGGQIFAQAMLCAERTTGKKDTKKDIVGEFASNSVQSMFLLAATQDRPIEYTVTRLRDGRSFCTRLVQAYQDDRLIFIAQISLCKNEASAFEHQDLMPRVPNPEKLEDLEDLIENLQTYGIKKQIIQNLDHMLSDQDQKFPFEFRPVNPDQFLGLRSDQCSSDQPLLYWMRCRLPLDPKNQDQHRFWLAFVTDATMIYIANLPHLSRDHQPSLLTSLDHSVHFHSPDQFRVDQWLLCECASPAARAGRALARGRVWASDGRLIASIGQESLSRAARQGQMA